MTIARGSEVLLQASDGQWVGSACQLVLGTD